MTAEQLKELLEKVTPGEWRVEGSYVVSDAMHEMDNIAESHRYEAEHDLSIIALAPSLARRVIAAEKLVGLLEKVDEGEISGDLYWALQDYREASK